MSVEQAAAPAAERRARRRQRQGSSLATLLTTTDHKTIGSMYLVTTFGFFMVGGLLALLMRAKLA